MIRSLTAIPPLRLHNQCIARAAHRQVADLVAWLGAAAVEQAFADGLILRTHVMRPTWHFVASPDIRWMLELTAPRVHKTLSHYRRRLGLDDRLCTRATALFERVLDEPLTV